MIAVTSSIESLAVIEREAREAAVHGISMHDSCRWPWDSVAGFAFKQAWAKHTESMKTHGTDPTPVTPSEPLQQAIA